MSIGSKVVLKPPPAEVLVGSLASPYWLSAKDRNPLLDDHPLRAHEQRLMAPLSGFWGPRPGFAARRRTRLLQHRCGE